MPASVFLPAGSQYIVKDRRTGGQKNRNRQRQRDTERHSIDICMQLEIYIYIYIYIYIHTQEYGYIYIYIYIHGSIIDGYCMCTHTYTYTLGWAENFKWRRLINCWWLFYSMGSKHCNIEENCIKRGRVRLTSSLRVCVHEHKYMHKLLVTIVEDDPKAPFSIATTPRCRGGRHSFPGLLQFTLDPYLIMLSVEQGGIKYHFLSLWYDSTWDWTQVSRAIGEHSNR